MKYIVIASILTITVLTSCEKENSVSEEVAITADEAEPVVDEAEPVVDEAEPVVDEAEPVVDEVPPFIEEDKEVPIVEQFDEPINFIEDIVEHVFIKRQCYVGEKFAVEGTVINPFQNAGFRPGRTTLFLEVNHKDVHLFSVDLRPLQDFLACEDYYKLGNTYVFPLFIRSITAPILNEPLDIDEKPRTIFRVSTRIMVTEELKLELRNVGCWKDKN